MTQLIPLNMFGFLDPVVILHNAGPWVLVTVMVIVFIESGLLFPFLPGDSLIFTAGLLSASLGLPVYVLIPAIAVAAILGDSAGFEIGRRFGRKLFKPDAKVLKTQHLDRADAFFAKYGGRSLVMARFVPVVRTYVPLVAGISKMRYLVFLRWNVIGGIGWATVCVLAGLWLGRIPLVADHVDLFAIAIVALSLIPVAIQILRSRKRTSEPAPSA